MVGHDADAGQRPTEIAVAVVEQDDRFLIRRRPPGAALAGLWEFPGGKIEPGERAADAARRECREETGLEVEIIGAYADQLERYEHALVRLRFLAARPCDAARQVTGGWQWAARAKLSDFHFPRGNRHLIRTLLAGEPPSDA